eukprot:368883-Lingulodinium_polyedra.AAC.1
MVEHQLQKARRQVFRQKRQGREAALSARQSAKEYLDQLISRIPMLMKIGNGQPCGVDARDQAPALHGVS